jgi:hypothetical protein
MESLAPKSNTVIVAQVPATIKQEIVARANKRGESASLIVREILKASSNPSKPEGVKP